MSAVDLYRKLLAISEEMVRSATREDATSLLALEAERAAVIADLQRTPTCPEEAATLRALIASIQSCDAEVLEYAEVHREQLGMLLRRMSPTART